MWRDEIRDVLAQYCRAVDRSDWELLRTVYHDDAVINHGVFQGDVAGFIEFVRGRRIGIVHTAHYLSNILVEPLRGLRASSEAYGWAVQSFTAMSPLVPAGYAGIRQQSTYRYVDLFECRGGRWAIAEAHLVLGDVLTEYLDEEPQRRAGFSQQPSLDDPLYGVLQRWAAE